MRCNGRLIVDETLLLPREGKGGGGHYRHVSLGGTMIFPVLIQSNIFTDLSCFF